MPSWIVVADASKARIYTQAAHLGELQEEIDMLHPEARQPKNSLASDEPGVQATAGGPGIHGMQEKVTPRQAEDQRFAREIVGKIRHALHAGEINEFYMSAPPHFLGLMRAALDDQTRKALKGDIDKSLIQATPTEVWAAFFKLQ